MAVWEALQIAMKRRKAKSKGEKERYKHLIDRVCVRPAEITKHGTGSRGAMGGARATQRGVETLGCYL